MHVIAKNLTYIVLLAVTLVSCGTTEEAHYRDTAMLEKPPTLVVRTPIEEQKEADSRAEPEAEAKTGLGTKVYMTDSNPPLLIIKQPFDEAWNTLAQALKQQALEITDRNRQEGAYYVTYDPDSYQADDTTIFSKMASFLSGEYAKEGYRLTVGRNDSETPISAAVVEDSQKSDLSDQQDGYYDKQPTDGAEKLLRSLYKTLRDDWVEK